jgi:hypothetical protein
MVGYMIYFQFFENHDYIPKSNLWIFRTMVLNHNFFHDNHRGMFLFIMTAEH